MDFQHKGYEIELIFLLLENTQQAIDRVYDRVLKGGHNVDEPTIQYRFNKGLALLNTTSAFRFGTALSFYAKSRYANCDAST